MGEKHTRKLGLNSLKNVCYVMLCYAMFRYLNSVLLLFELICDILDLDLILVDLHAESTLEFLQLQVHSAQFTFQLVVLFDNRV